MAFLSGKISLGGRMRPPFQWNFLSVHLQCVLLLWTECTNEAKPFPRLWTLLILEPSSTLNSALAKREISLQSGSGAGSKRGSTLSYFFNILIVYFRSIKNISLCFSIEVKYLVCQWKFQIMQSFIRKRSGNIRFIGATFSRNIYKVTWAGVGCQNP